MLNRFEKMIPMKGNHRQSKKNIKYLLAIIWLCFFMPFRESFIAKHPSLGATVMFENFHEYNPSWKSCIDFIESQNILCSIEIACKDIINPNLVNNQLIRLAKAGHYLDGDPSCNDYPSVLYPTHIHQTKAMLGFVWLPSILTRRKAVLSLSLSHEIFVIQYGKIKNRNQIIFKDDPTYWNEHELINFQENMRFLISNDLIFLHPAGLLD